MDAKTRFRGYKFRGTALYTSRLLCGERGQSVRLSDGTFAALGNEVMTAQGRETRLYGTDRTTMTVREARDADLLAEEV